MDNLTVRALSEEMAYIKGYTDALGEINGKRRRKQEQQKKKSEHRAKVAAGIMCGTTLLVLSGIVGLIDKDATFCVFVESCIADLQLAGVNTIDEKDPLIISAVKQYCKGYFGSSDKADEYKKAYESIKLSLSLSGKHTEVPVPPEEPKPPEITVGATVIVSGTIYTEIDSYRKSITKAAAKMYVKELLDPEQHRYYIGVAREKDGAVEGYAIREICRVIE